MKKWILKKGDYGVELGIQLLRSDGTSRDCTGLTATLLIRELDDLSTAILTDTLAPVDVAVGRFKWVVPQTVWDVLTVGNYACEVELTISGMKDSSYDFELEVVPSP